MNTTIAHDETTRRSLLAKATTALVAASMGGILAQKSVSACAPPLGCYGLPACGCHGGGCTAEPSGGCCWSYVSGCSIFYCCDQTCHDGVRGICKYLLCTQCGC
jgi:hypothetical protein